MENWAREALVSTLCQCQVHGDHDDDDDGDGDDDDENIHDKDEKHVCQVPQPCDKVPENDSGPIFWPPEHRHIPHILRPQNT